MLTKILLHKSITNWTGKAYGTTGESEKREREREREREMPMLQC